MKFKLWKMQKMQFEAITFHRYDELDDVAVEFLCKEVSEPEEITDDDSDCGPRLKI